MVERYKACSSWAEFTAFSRTCGFFICWHTDGQMDGLNAVNKDSNRECSGRKIIQQVTFRLAMRARLSTLWNVQLKILCISGVNSMFWSLRGQYVVMISDWSCWKIELKFWRISGLNSMFKFAHIYALPVQCCFVKLLCCTIAMFVGMSRDAW